jgi:hypothetical protein
MEFERRLLCCICNIDADFIFLRILYNFLDRCQNFEGNCYVRLYISTPELGLYVFEKSWKPLVQHNTTQHNTTQHNTTHRIASQHNTTQHNTAQHNTTQHNTLLAMLEPEFAGTTIVRNVGNGIKPRKI